MRLTRKEDISLYLYIKDVLLGPEFSEEVVGASLINSGTNTWDLSYEVDWICPFRRGDESGRGRGLVYFDHLDNCSVFGPEQTAMIRVYNGLTVASGYSVNYVTGQLVTPADLIDYQADYYWNYVAVLDAWPYEDVPSLPVVSLELQEGSSLPLQLGYGDIRSTYWNVQIFANSKGERDDIVDIIFDGINKRQCPVYKLEQGLPLLQSGLFNSQFNIDLLDEYTALFFEKVEKRLTGLPRWGFYQAETINRYRAEVTFETKGYRK